MACSSMMRRNSSAATKGPSLVVTRSPLPALSRVCVARGTCLPPLATKYVVPHPDVNVQVADRLSEECHSGRWLDETCHVGE